MVRKARDRGQPKVLVVDDEPDLLELLELTLSRMGLDTTRAQTVGEATRLLDTNAFDLCLTDMRLPDGEGLTVVEHITNKGLDVPVAVITAFGSAENAVAALKAGAFDYLAKPFAPVNCGAIPENLMESEFFGYKKGAFTGAEGDRDGFFQAANNGTLFLDEVADLPLAMQVKLLRAIQEKKVRKVGATAEEPVDVRIISATHKKLPALVDAGEFRQDLFYRLHVIELAMPSLREMREDIPSIADAILKKLARGIPAKLDPAAANALEAYPFPGNVRELENILERGLSLAPDPLRISADDLHLTPPPEEGDASLPTGDKWPF